MVFGVTVAAVLWVFAALGDHRDRIVRLEERDAANSVTLLEVRDDVKMLLAGEARRIGRESFSETHAGSSTEARSGNSRSALQ